LETDNYPSLRATQIGNIATEYWQQIPQHFPFVLLDEFIVMPNHFHGILIINKPLVETDNNLSPQEWNPNQFGSQSQNLASIIRGYKASVKRFANLNNIPFEWQPKYWDRVIRDENELIIIRNYINLNPGNWLNDEHYCRAT
jgi:REP element-mobilizing transposase RayT